MQQKERREEREHYVAEPLSPRAKPNIDEGGPAAKSSPYAERTLPSLPPHAARKRMYEQVELGTVCFMAGAGSQA